MTISGISATDELSGLGTTSTGTPTSSLDKDAFMRLLVEQMKNQDPMSPQDNSQTIAQLAQFSSLEQMTELNDNIVGLAVLQQNNALMSQLTQSSSLIGQTVSYIDPASGDTETGTVTSVKIQDGLAVLNIGGQDIPLSNVTEVSSAPADDTADTETDDGSDTTDDTDENSEITQP
jgi:flagellar basal-body rod modification protein FlgD